MNRHESLVDYVREHVLDVIKEELMKLSYINERATPNSLELSVVYHEPFGLTCFYYTTPWRSGKFTVKQDDFAGMTNLDIIERYVDQIYVTPEEFVMDAL